MPEASFPLHSAHANGLRVGVLSSSTASSKLRTEITAPARPCDGMSEPFSLALASGKARNFVGSAFLWSEEREEQNRDITLCCVSNRVKRRFRAVCCVRDRRREGRLRNGKNEDLKMGLKAKRDERSAQWDDWNLFLGGL